MKILSEIKNYDKKVILTALGQFGMDLYNLSEIIDILHPDICSFPIDNNTSIKLINCLELIKYAFDKNLNESIDGIFKFFTKNISIDLDLHKHVRLIKDNIKKCELRSCKENFNVKLNDVKFLWLNSEKNFDIYQKDNNKFEPFVYELLKKSNYYEEIGCVLIGSKLKKIANNLSSTYFGFHKILLKEASVIVAKMNGASLDESKITFRGYPYISKMCSMGFFGSELPNQLSWLEKDFSLFDYYFVMIPSNSITSLDEDKNLLKENFINPIVVGERNGLFYFLSFWR
jgi:hypothetical protein